MKTLQKGFSLVELMIVVAIIGILASVAIPRLLNYICTTRAKAVMANLAEAKHQLANEFTKLQSQADVFDYTNTLFKGETAADGVTGMIEISKPAKGSIVPFVSAAAGVDESYQVAVSGSNSTNFVVAVGNYSCNGVTITPATSWIVSSGN